MTPHDKPRCAVLLAAFNGMQFIEEQVVSILKQQHCQVTLFISVDVSSDGTETWVAAQAKKYSNIILLPTGIHFGGAAKNFFRLIREVEFTEFDYVALADQDDIWFLDKLNRAIAAMHTNAVDAYSSNVIAFWENGHEVTINKAHPQKRWDYLFESAGPGCTYVLTTKLMQAIKAHLIANWHEAQKLDLHDWYCYAFARSKGYRWFIDPHPSMRYRQHSQNEFGVNYGRAALWKRWQRIRKGWWLSQILLLTEVLALTDCPFIQKKGWRKRDFLSIAFASKQCRRQQREAFFLSFLCFLFILLPRIPLQQDTQA